MPPGRMVRLRGLAGVPEWTGKWSDEDPSWTNQLRQMMQFSKDAQVRVRVRAGVRVRVRVRVS